MAQFQAIVMKEKDNVCTVIETIIPGTDVGINFEGKPITIHATDSIPLGHKLALRDIGQGEFIVKYGEIIGLATQNIMIGQHVHIHNLESCRGRGDK